MKRASKFKCLLGSTLLCAATLAMAQEQPSHGGQSLEQAASDPTASLANLQIQDVYSGEYHGLDDETGNTVLVRAALPFKAGGLNNIVRATLPLVTDSPSGESGLGDLVLFDLIVFDQDWGRWGVGPVALLPSATDDALGAEKWALGPAVGFVAHSEGLLLGVFNQNLFTVAGDDDREDVNISIIQPIVSYSLGAGWSIGSSEMNITYDWEASDWSELPLGMKLSKMHKFGQLPVQFSGAYEYNFADDEVGPEWTINLTAKFLFPV